MKVNTYQMALARRRAAILGIPVDEHLRNVAAEQRRLDEHRRIISDRVLQWAILEAYAAAHGRVFVRRGP